MYGAIYKCYNNHTSSNYPRVAAGRTEMLNLLLHLSEWRNNNGKDGRVAVVSHDGVSKIGVFCTASYCYEQIGARGLVDVFQVWSLTRFCSGCFLYKISDH